MRCHFCGWDNPEGRERCEKCNKPLQADHADATSHEHPTRRMPPQGIESLKATVPESMARPADKNECPECGYPLEGGACAHCGYTTNPVLDPPAPAKPQNETQHPIHKQPMIQVGKDTVRPKRKGEKEGRFVLTPISEDNGMSEGESKVYDGNKVVLNRENTDPRNTTITSQVQAIVSRENGQWFIEDQSELRTTFVQAARKTEIRGGDLILMGNQLFRFDYLDY